MTSDRYEKHIIHTGRFGRTAQSLQENKALDAGSDGGETGRVHRKPSQLRNGEEEAEFPQRGKDGTGNAESVSGCGLGGDR